MFKAGRGGAKTCSSVRGVEIPAEGRKRLDRGAQEGSVNSRMKKLWGERNKRVAGINYDAELRTENIEQRGNGKGRRRAMPSGKRSRFAPHANLDR